MKLLKKASILGISTALLLTFIPAVTAEVVPSPMGASPPASPMPTPMPVLMPFYTPTPMHPTDISGHVKPTDSSATSQAASVAKISRDKAIELAASLVKIPEDYIMQNISFNFSYNRMGQSLWNLQFTKKDSDRYYGNINISIDADNGKLLNFNRNDNDPDNKPVYPPKVSFQAAKELATQWLPQYNPIEAKQTLYNSDSEKSFKTPLNGDVRYYIKFDRAANDIPYPQNYITFSIDGDGNLIGYEFKWDDKTIFLDAASILTQEQAVQAFKDTTPLYLMYLTPRNASFNTSVNASTFKPTLSYELIAALLDANTGKEITDMGYDYYRPSTNKVTLTELPLAGLPVNNLNLTKEQAIDRVSKLITLPKKAVLQNASYNENSAMSKISSGSGSEISTWNLYWKIPGVDQTNETYINATINSKNGVLTNYNLYSNEIYGAASSEANTTEETQIKLDKAKTAAIEFVKKALPQYTHQLALDEQALQYNILEKSRLSNSANINFKRVIQGIFTEHETVNVGFNLKTGQILNYWNSISNIEYPTTKPTVLSEDKAKDLLMARNTIVLRYVIANPEQGKGPQPLPISAWDSDTATSTVTNATYINEARPVYQLVPHYTDEQIYLDAQTGEWHNRETGAITVPGKPVITDLSEHWAQLPMQLMVDYKAIDVKDGKVNPDQSITRGEMIKMLMIARNGGYFGPMYDSSRKASFADVANGSSFFSYVESAVDAKIIDPKDAKTFNVNGVMNREELAQLLVRALGYDKLANYSDLFNLHVKDTTEVKLKGQVAIILALGILTANEGNFTPAQDVSRAQAATAFYRYLQKRSTLQDNPITMHK